jgi:hypothetical protein
VCERRPTNTERVALGTAELEIAQGAAGATKALEAAGVSDVAEGSMEVGAGLGAEAAVAATKRSRKPARKGK